MYSRSPLPHAAGELAVDEDRDAAVGAAGRQVVGRDQPIDRRFDECRLGRGEKGVGVETGGGARGAGWPRLACLRVDADSTPTAAAIPVAPTVPTVLRKSRRFSCSVIVKRPPASRGDGRDDMACRNAVVVEQLLGRAAARNLADAEALDRAPFRSPRPRPPRRCRPRRSGLRR